ncbi:hypothetical protein LTR10_022039 [Elasticomyces elasticus]|uniref:Glucose-repressible protein n=1 Tax=Exophiala sideris TaxID=1016849 RepID=A0ABR0JME4_9EURO|nr:hypothetical protein LTR10_022039 [Elasticomyces elasticus]KAK5036474.1 hypothetical protein LTS07_002201 [Exophiala sideris]KAK5041697.1 hypothetical protein LTR13_002364 [Exophiala sideris]KAK5066857.1 hypothetical protein LTR69_002205 [Exophiala sideris]KAK5184916.1 hypothetical protein LTR44_002762 [Eurotiomycetes sp. CCFEE 6388]
MDKVKSIVTGDAYDKPAKTVDGAMTTQDSSDAHTVKGTPAEGTAAENKLSGDPSQVKQTTVNKANEAKEKAKETKDQHTN